MGAQAAALFAQLLPQVEPASQTIAGQTDPPLSQVAWQFEPDSHLT